MDRPEPLEGGFYNVNKKHIFRGQVSKHLAEKNPTSLVTIVVNLYERIDYLNRKIAWLENKEKDLQKE